MTDFLMVERINKYIIMDCNLLEIKIDPELVNLQYKNYCEALITRIEEQDKSIVN